MRQSRVFQSLLFFVLIWPLSACSMFGGKNNLSGTGDLTKSKGHYKVGSPYTIKGVRYYPRVDYAYDEKGIASWYGPNFHGKLTANGEIYDQNELTAAHKTLPLPSIVRVTNLENGKSLIVRVNDRGPYASGRIIDMSKRSAELLGFKNQGIAKVRVQVLEEESRTVAHIARSGGSTKGMENEMNSAGYNPRNSGNIDYSKVQPKFQTLETNQGASIPGHVKNGNFYPDPILSEYPVSPQKIFVQTGAFSSREAATRHASSLDNFGRAQVFPASVNGNTIFRVRFPSTSVTAADDLLSKLVSAGYDQAVVVVDKN